MKKTILISIYFFLPILIFAETGLGSEVPWEGFFDNLWKSIKSIIPVIGVIGLAFSGFQVAKNGAQALEKVMWVIIASAIAIGGQAVLNAFGVTSGSLL